jgi:hypothetical protein
MIECVNGVRGFVGHTYRATQESIPKSGLSGVIPEHWRSPECCFPAVWEVSSGWMNASDGVAVEARRIQSVSSRQASIWRAAARTSAAAAASWTATPTDL